MSDARLIVNGRSYGGWKSLRVTRSIESICGSFDLEVADRWSDFEEYTPITRENACRVEIDGLTVIDGYVDKCSISLSATSKGLTFSGRDRAAALVDCSAVLGSIRNATVLDIARKVADPYGIKVSIQPGLVLPKAAKKTAIQPGDTPFQVIQRAAQAAGVLVVSDGAGGIVITGAGAVRATRIVEGENLLEGSIDYDGTERFRRYIVATQVPGTDAASGSATRIRGEATDEGVRRTDRVLFIHPDSGLTADFAKRRADWEARIRAAKAETVNVSVLGWTQPGGGLWPLNARINVFSPTLRVDGDLLISQVEHTLGDGGEVTRLRLVRPDAFTPEPKAVVRKSGALWPELEHGAR